MPYSLTLFKVICLFFRFNSLWEGDLKPHRATFQQYALVTAEFAAKVPDNVSLDEAASIPATLATAYLGLYNKKKDDRGGGAELTPFWQSSTAYAGQPIVVFGGATSVGQFGERSVVLNPASNGAQHVVQLFSLSACLVSLPSSRPRPRSIHRSSSLSGRRTSSPAPSPRTPSALRSARSHRTPLRSSTTLSAPWRHRRQHGRSSPRAVSSFSSGRPPRASCTAKTERGWCWWQEIPIGPARKRPDASCSQGSPNFYGMDPSR